jgi:hypothetical protein
MAPGHSTAQKATQHMLCAQVFWEGDGAWYRGSVTGYSATTQRHTILYDDNDIERVVLDAVPHRCISTALHPVPPSRVVHCVLRRS